MLFWRSSNNNVFVYTSLTRQIPIYVLKTKELIAVSNSSMVLALLGAPSGLPEYDPIGVLSFLHSGNVFSDRTLFKDVKIIDNNKYVTIKDGLIDARACDSTLHSLGLESGDDSTYFDALAESFVRACTVSGRGSLRVGQGLTGGKDSRLVISGLRRGGFEIQASTHQTQSTESADLDVVIAREIAGILGIPHVVSVAKEFISGQMTTGFKPGAVANRILVIRDAASVFLPRLPDHTVVESVQPINVPLPVFSGLGGELLRGGYASLDLNWLRYNPDQVEDPEQVVRQKITSGLEKYSPGYARELSDDRISFLNDLKSYSGTDGVLELYYLFFNIGRSGIGSFKEAETKTLLALPFCDNKVLRLALAGGRKARMEERLHQEIIRRLAPEIISVPLAEYSWGRGKDRATRAETPVTSEIEAKHYPIFWHVHGALHEELYETVRASSLLSDLVSNEERDSLFKTRRIHFPANATAAWKMYYVAKLLSNDWVEDRAGRFVVVDHGRPWFNMLREYEDDMGKRLRVLKDNDKASATVSKASATLSEVSYQVTSRLGERFSSAEFFGEIHKRNMASIAKGRRGSLESVKQALIEQAKNVKAGRPSGGLPEHTARQQKKWRWWANTEN